MRLSTKGFAEAVTRLQQLANVSQTQQFQQVLVNALQPMADQAKANVHSVTGRTVQSITVLPGKNPQYPSAYVKADKKIASKPWRRKPFFYPAVVDAKTGFFRDAVTGGRSAARRIVKDGIEEVLRPYHTSLIGGEFS